MVINQRTTCIVRWMERSIERLLPTHGVAHTGFLVSVVQERRGLQACLQSAVGDRSITTFRRSAGAVPALPSSIQLQYEPQVGVRWRGRDMACGAFGPPLVPLRDHSAEQLSAFAASIRCWCSTLPGLVPLTLGSPVLASEPPADEFGTEQPMRDRICWAWVVVVLKCWVSSVVVMPLVGRTFARLCWCRRLSRITVRRATEG